MKRGVYISGDVLHDMIVSGQVEPGGEPADEVGRQIELIKRNFCVLVQAFGES